MAKNHTTDADRAQPGNGATDGRHGNQTHEAFIDGLHGKHGGSEESEGSPQAENTQNPVAGHHRLHEERQQHDEAEKNSEANRLRR